MNKKGQVFDQLGKLAIGAVIVAIVLVVGFLIIAQMNTQLEAIDGVDQNTSAENATETIQTALGTIPTWVGLIILVSIGAILIGLVSRGFGQR